MPNGLEPILINAAKIFIVTNVLMVSVAAVTWVERRLSAVIQFRLGPNRVGPAGLLQPIADGIKFIMKEEVIPAQANKVVFVLAPFIALVSAMCAFCVIPFGTQVEIGGRVIDLVILDLDAGLLVALAASSLGVYGIVCAGWSSNSKYALIGGLRASAQMVSYELSLGLSLVGVLIVSGTLRPQEIVAHQAGSILQWNVFGGGWQILGFLIFMVAGYAETNRLPFDMPEAESELVAGYHTEYSAMKFSMFFMAEYIAMITISAMATTLFLGGYLTGFPALDTMGGLLGALIQVGAFAFKVGCFLFLFVWVRWTLPRFRYDQLMDLGWKRLFPLSLINLIITALLVAFDIV